MSLIFLFCLDLCLDDESDRSSELEPNTIQLLDLHMKDLSTRRYNAICKQKHICVELDSTLNF